VLIKCLLHDRCKHVTGGGGVGGGREIVREREGVNEGRREQERSSHDKAEGCRS
jgi:hypothetical protein